MTRVFSGNDFVSNNITQEICETQVKDSEWFNNSNHKAKTHFLSEDQGNENVSNMVDCSLEPHTTPQHNERELPIVQSRQETKRKETTTNEGCTN